ncbi:MAG: homoserine kinase [Butyricicoccus pullicaecorum]|nr:homoserine kinase [Butyricicoccus pullicaecorum]
MGVSVKVPATSANMGSGYDSIGIALNLYNVITMEESDHIDITDVNGQKIPTDDTNLIYQCAKKVYDICGKSLSGLKITENCAIPQTRGLGSSSACTVAGILGANALLGEPLDQENVIDLAASIEGHPDNSTPAILGGFCVALLEYGKVWSVRVPMNGTVDFITFIPDFELSTEKARAALPKQVAHHDAVFNLARAALLAGSLVTGKLENVGVAVGDCLHQPYRFGLIPDGTEIVHAAKRMGALGAFISGAGPSMIAIVDSTDKTYLSRAQMYCEQHFPHWKPMRLTCDEVGATVTRF